MQRRIRTRRDHKVPTRLDETVEALGHYPEYLTWYGAEVQKGIDAADVGLSKSHAEVGAILEDAGVDLDQAARLDNPRHGR